MFGIEGKYLEPIHNVAKQFDPYPVYNSEKLGAWGILFLCCGALAARNSLWRDRAYNSDTFVSPSDLAKLLQGSYVCTSDKYAVRFSEFIKEELSNSSSAIAMAEERMKKNKGKMSDKVFLYHKTYLSMALMLNSFEGMPMGDLLGFDCKTWVSVSNGKNRNYGWPELFFAAGFLLNNDDNIGCQKMMSVIHGMGKSSKIDVIALFEHYAGKNPFLKTEIK